MSAHTIIEDLVNYLEQEKAAGGDSVYLSPRVRRELFEDFSSTAQAVESLPAAGDSSSRDGHSRQPAGTFENLSAAGVQQRVADEPGRGAVSDRPPVQSETAARSDSVPAALDWPALEEAVADCRVCALHRIRARSFFEQGGRRAELMLIGDSPPAREVADMLERMVAAMQFKPEEVYLTNIVKCQTPGGRWPDQAEVQACIGYLQRQIELVRPRAIVLLGAMAMECLLGQKSITRWRGRWQRYRDISTMAIYHPRFMMKHRQAKAEAWQDLQCVMHLCGRQTNS